MSCIWTGLPTRFQLDFWNRLQFWLHFHLKQLLIENYNLLYKHVWSNQLAFFFCVFYTGNGYGWAWPPTWNCCLYNFFTPHIPRLLSAKSLIRWCHYHQHKYGSLVGCRAISCQKDWIQLKQHGPPHSSWRRHIVGTFLLCSPSFWNSLDNWS